MRTSLRCLDGEDHFLAVVAPISAGRVVKRHQQGASRRVAASAHRPHTIVGLSREKPPLAGLPTKGSVRVAVRLRLSGDREGVRHSELGLRRGQRRGALMLAISGHVRIIPRFRFPVHQQPAACYVEHPVF